MAVSTPNTTARAAGTLGTTTTTLTISMMAWTFAAYKAAAGTSAVRAINLRVVVAFATATTSRNHDTLAQVGPATPDVRCTTTSTTGTTHSPARAAIGTSVESPVTARARAPNVDVQSLAGRYRQGCLYMPSKTTRPTNCGSRVGCGATLSTSDIDIYRCNAGWHHPCLH